MSSDPTFHLDTGSIRGPLFLYPRLVFDAAFLGWGHRPGDPYPIPIYDLNTCVKAVQYWYELSLEAAHEYVVTQCEGSWLGPGSPLILRRSSASDYEQLT